MSDAAPAYGLWSLAIVNAAVFIFFAQQEIGFAWDEATFTEYIKDPKAKIPGTKMVYAGLKDEKRIADLIAYLKQFDKTGKKTTQAPGRLFASTER